MAMPRPRKCRKVCHLPHVQAFRPEDGGEERQAVVMTVDEYETIRLLDREGFSQEECGRYMGISRTTVQQVYDAARKKVALALVEGCPLHIKGGDYRLCDGAEPHCACGGCRRHRQLRVRSLEEKEKE